MFRVCFITYCCRRWSTLQASRVSLSTMLRPALSAIVLALCLVSLAEAKKRTKTVSMCPPAPTHGSNLTCPAPVLANSTRWDGRSWVSDPTNKTWTIAWQPSYNKATDGTGYCNADVNPNNTFTRSCSFEVSCFKALGVMNASLVFHSMNVSVDVNSSEPSNSVASGGYEVTLYFDEFPAAISPLSPYLDVHVLGSMLPLSRNGAAALVTTHGNQSVIVNITIVAPSSSSFANWNNVAFDVSALFECASYLPPEVTPAPPPPVTQWFSLNATLGFSGSEWVNVSNQSSFLVDSFRESVAAIFEVESFRLNVHFVPSPKGLLAAVNFSFLPVIGNLTLQVLQLSNNSNFASTIQLYNAYAVVGGDAALLSVVSSVVVYNTSSDAQPVSDKNTTTSPPIAVITPAPPSNAIHGNNPVGVVVIIVLGSIAAVIVAGAVSYRTYMHCIAARVTDGAKGHDTHAAPLLISKLTPPLADVDEEENVNCDDIKVHIGHKAVEDDFAEVDL